MQLRPPSKLNKKKKRKARYCAQCGQGLHVDITGKYCTENCKALAFEERKRKRQEDKERNAVRDQERKKQRNIDKKKAQQEADEAQFEQSRQNAVKKLQNLFDGDEEAAKKLEKRLKKMHLNDANTKEYTRHVQNIVSNLKQNRKLLDQVLGGDVTLKRLANMSVEDMAPDHLAEQRRQAEADELSLRILKEKPKLGKIMNQQLATDNPDLGYRDNDDDILAIDLNASAAIAHTKLTGSTKMIVDDEAKSDPSNGAADEMEIDIDPDVDVSMTNATDSSEEKKEALEKEKEKEKEEETETENKPDVSETDNGKENKTDCNAQTVSKMDVDDEEEVRLQLSEDSDDDLLKGMADGDVEESIWADLGLTDEKDSLSPPPNKKRRLSSSAKQSSKKTSTIKKMVIQKKKTPEEEKKEESPSSSSPRSAHAPEPQSSSSASSKTLLAPPPLASFSADEPEPPPSFESPSRKKRKRTFSDMEKQPSSRHHRHSGSASKNRTRWGGMWITSKTNQTGFRIRIDRVGGADTNYPKLIPKKICVCGRVKVEAINASLREFAQGRKTQKITSMFRVKKEDEGDDSQSSFEDLMEAFRSEGKGCVVDLKKQHKIKMYFLPPNLNGLDSECVLENWGKHPPTECLWGFLIHYRSGSQN